MAICAQNANRAFSVLFITIATILVDILVYIHCIDFFSLQRYQEWVLHTLTLVSRRRLLAAEWLMVSAPTFPQPNKPFIRAHTHGRTRTHISGPRSYLSTSFGGQKTRKMHVEVYIHVHNKYYSHHF